MVEEPIYLDYQATTPVDQRVVDAMLPYFTTFYGNPHAEENLHGQIAAKGVEEARLSVARLIGATPREILFTSGATEANNIIISGITGWLRAKGRGHVITTTIEHKAVLNVFQKLANIGHDVTFLDVDANGLISLDQLAGVTREDTGLVSVMAANNEIGVLQPITEIGSFCADRNILFHTDAAQAAGKIDIDVNVSNVDFLSISAHKLYGPKGVGAAFVRKKYLRHIEAVYSGGGQELGLRPGTVPTPLCVGFGLACNIAAGSMKQEEKRLTAYRTRFLKSLHDAKLEFQVNGDLNRRLPGNLNISFTGVDAEALLMAVRSSISIATGSACNAKTVEPSHVLQALGFDLDRCESAVRISFGRMTNDEEVVDAANSVIDAVQKLRKFHYSIPA